jgi:hypothetical protein
MLNFVIIILCICTLQPSFAVPIASANALPEIHTNGPQDADSCPFETLAQGRFKSSRDFFTIAKAYFQRARLSQFLDFWKTCLKEEVIPIPWSIGHCLFAK